MRVLTTSAPPVIDRLGHVGPFASGICPSASQPVSWETLFMYLCAAYGRLGTVSVGSSESKNREQAPELQQVKPLSATWQRVCPSFSAGRRHRRLGSCSPYGFPAFASA